MDKPLFFDEQIERKERTRFVHRLNNWMHKLHLGSWISRNPGRKSVESQLRQRNHFAEEQWNEYGPLTKITTIAKTIAWELALPNHYFLPNDPLLLIMNSAHGIDSNFVLEALEEKYGVKYQGEELEMIQKEEWTLGQFIENLLKKAKIVQKNH